MPSLKLQACKTGIQMTDTRRQQMQLRISPDLEAAIAKRASTAGEPVPDYIRRILHEATSEDRKVLATK